MFNSFVYHASEDFCLFEYEMTDILIWFMAVFTFDSIFKVFSREKLSYLLKVWVLETYSFIIDDANGHPQAKGLLNHFSMLIFRGSIDLCLVENSLTFNEQSSTLHPDLEDILTKVRMQWAISSFAPYISTGPGWRDLSSDRDPTKLLLCLVFKSCFRIG